MYRPGQCLRQRMNLFVSIRAVDLTYRYALIGWTANHKTAGGVFWYSGGGLSFFLKKYQALKINKNIFWPWEKKNPDRPEVFFWPRQNAIFWLLPSKAQGCNGFWKPCRVGILYSILRWVPMCQGFSHFSVFLH